MHKFREFLQMFVIDMVQGLALLKKKEWQKGLFLPSRLCHWLKIIFVMNFVRCKWIIHLEKKKEQQQQQQRKKSTNHWSEFYLQMLHEKRPQESKRKQKISDCSKSTLREKNIGD